MTVSTLCSTCWVVGLMVEVPDEVGREIAAEFRRYTAGPDTAFYQHCADLLDPPKPPPDEQDTESTRTDGIDTAWGLIANAYGGNWELASDEWRDAAERWRDENLKSPPPTLVEQVLAHFDLNTNIDITDDLKWTRHIVTETLAVVRAAVEELSVALVDDGTYLYRPDVLDLLGGGSDA